MVHRREHASNALPLPVSRRWTSPARSFSQAFSEHCKNTETGWCITRYAFLHPQLSLGTHSSLTIDGRLRLSRPGGLVLRRGIVYPSKDGHPPRR